jgi:hypothetical protein
MSNNATMTDDIDDHTERIAKALEDAQQVGIVAYCVLHTTDPIRKSASTRFVGTADHVLALGLVRAANLFLESDYLADDNDEEPT